GGVPAAPARAGPGGGRRGGLPGGGPGGAGGRAGGAEGERDPGPVGPGGHGAGGAAAGAGPGAPREGGGGGWRSRPSWGGARAEPEDEAEQAPPEAADRALRRALVAEALARLEEAERTILVLRDVEGRSYEEIAGRVGCTVAAVGPRLTRARERLRQALHP